jgi:hypothetical protein
MGSTGILTAMQRLGPEKLIQGILNEHLIPNTIVSVHPNGLEAIARGLEIEKIGDANTRAVSWEFSVFRNKSVKGGDGIWKFKELNMTLLIVANYSARRGNSSIVPLPSEVPNFLDVSGRSSRSLDGAPGAIAIASVADLQMKLGKRVAYMGSRMCTCVWVLCR